ncbi:MAG: tRNA 2-selenouridine(34) synthase MnmH [Deltaproteobacteria bacterium]|nr:tRNA 2-selenouridine(34) synthase MnmH [Deltaproteobacteria bacterium]
MMAVNYYNGELKSLFLEDIPLIDVRSPVEFAQGAFPGAINIPILDNEQRHKVGLCYKNEGREEAIKLGYSLVYGDDRKGKTGRWLQVADKSSVVVIYCFRGGLRSQIAQSWLKEEGREVALVKGGYKRLRNYLINKLEEEVENNRFFVISGYTGSGKTTILNNLINEGYKGIDLEGFANHRGSAFGHNPTAQPTQINFENAVFIALLKEEKKTSSFILIEDESATIGGVTLPHSLYEKKKQSPVFVLKIPRPDRAKIILNEYVKARWEIIKDEHDPYGALYKIYSAPFEKIKKRLGGLLYSECISDLENAIEEMKTSGSFHLHKIWIEKLLYHYYDPLYAKGLARKKEHIVGEGSEEEMREFLKKWK